ncbi:MAG: hypothetical protein EHM84_04180 [Lysobacterales bacterium]|jgi:hypothetical protein|nr:MAG: hypothetical protein EHM84_04180 [Xanthomonadales bacterium]
MKDRVRLSICVAALALAAPAAGPAGEPDTQQSEKPYRIVDGKVDAATFTGWRAFHSACHTCHGVDATGTSLAPNLVERIRQLSASDFSTKVITSYRLVFQSDEMRGDDPTAVRSEFLEEVMRRERGELVMPAWEGDQKIRPHVLDLYAYLRARGDGALGPGRPQQIGD